MSIITLNGTQIFPTDAPKKRSKIGRLQTNANGGNTFVQRTVAGSPVTKSVWDLSFDNITEARRATVESLYAVAAAMAYVDQKGTTYSVICAEDGYNESVSLILPDGTYRYTVSLTLLEV